MTRTASSRRRAPGGWFWILIALAGCAAPRAWEVPGSGARVVASSEDAQRLCALIERHEQEVIAMLGTSWDEPYEVRVEKTSRGQFGETNLARRYRWVIIDPRTLQGDLEGTMIHELAHVHMGEPWARLPYAVQEGLCYWLQARLGSQAKEAVPPDPAALCRALTLTMEEYMAQDGHPAILQAGLWLASQLMPVETAESSDP